MHVRVRLPKTLDVHPAKPRIERLFTAETAPLWPGGTVAVPSVAPTKALRDALHLSRGAGVLVRGIETAKKHLDAERKGLEKAKGNVAAQPRISRLLLISDEATERFARDVEHVLRDHADRLQCLRIKARGPAFHQGVFGDDALVQCLLIADKDAAARTLLALATDS